MPGLVLGASVFEVVSGSVVPVGGFEVVPGSFVVGVGSLEIVFGRIVPGAMVLLVVPGSKVPGIVIVAGRSSLSVFLSVARASVFEAAPRSVVPSALVVPG